MVFIPWSEAAGSAFNALPAPVQSAVNNARSFGCQLYKDYNGYFGNTAPAGPLEGLKRGVWDKVCPTGNPPPATNPPPWNGDTCACVQYQVRVVSRGEYAPNGEFVSLPTVTGPVYGLVDIGPSGSASASWNVRHGVCSGGQLVGVTNTGATTIDKRASTSIEGITRVGGGSNCPSPPPPPAPTPPPPERQSDRGDLVIAPNVSINVPVTLVSPSVNVDINPSVEIAVGPFNVNFGIGGINVDINPEFSPTIIAPTVNLPPLPPGSGPRPSPLPPSGGDCPDPCPEVDYGIIEDLIKDERKFYARAKTSLIPVQLASGRGGSVELPERTKFVRVQVTTPPRNIKTQAGTGGVDVYYCGWCSWGNGSVGERVPVNYLNCSFSIESRSDTFSWTLYNGGIAQISALVEIDLEECETNECGTIS